MTGSEFADAIQSLSQDEIQALILDLYKKGDVPNFVRLQPWRGVNLSATIETKVVNLFVYVSPFLAVGTDDDPFYPPMHPVTLQAIADLLGSVMLTPTIVDAAFASAKVKVPLQVPSEYRDKKLTIPGPDMQKPPAFAASSALIAAATRGKNTADVAGHSKNVVTGPHLDGSRVAIYGGYDAGPADLAHPKVQGWAWQGYPGPHEVDWVDYSQKGQLVFDKANLDGPTLVSLQKDVFPDPALSTLVSRPGGGYPGGAFDPRFPNGGKKTGTTGGGGGGDRPPPPPRTPPTPVETSSDAGLVGAVVAIGLGAGLVLGGGR